MIKIESTRFYLQSFVHHKAQQNVDMDIKIMGCCWTLHKWVECGQKMDHVQKSTSHKNRNKIQFGKIGIEKLKIPTILG